MGHPVTGIVTFTAQRTAESGIVVIIRETDPGTAIETVDAFRRGGVSTVEIIANIESVLDMIRDVSELFAVDEVTIDAGTVLDVETARATILASAEFIVMPSSDEGIVETTNRYDVPSLVGTVMPTGAVNAFEAGADVVKVFPADTLGPRFISAPNGSFGHIPTVPTGGVGPDNVDEFFDAGATAVGVGSSIVDTEAIACGEFDVVEANVRVFREAVEAARSE